MQEIYEQLIKGIKKYFRKSGIARAVVGVSGGIDSAVTLKLAVDALGPEKVTAISMPELGLSNPINATHAKKLSEALGVTFFSQPINSYLTAFTQTRWGNSTLSTINTKARVRAVLLYHYANVANALVLGTSNKSEILLGYGTKYGDLAADLEVIGELYKDDVYALADHLELPKEIINKAPSAELFHGQTDENELGAPYSELDPILRQINLGQDALLAKGINPGLLHNIFNRIEKNKHKADAPPLIKIKRENPAPLEPEETQSSLPNS